MYEDKLRVHSTEIRFGNLKLQCNAISLNIIYLIPQACRYRSSTLSTILVFNFASSFGYGETGINTNNVTHDFREHK